MRQIDVHQIIDNARFSRFHWMVMALCALLLIFDGYDLFIYGVVLPSIMQEWNLTPMEAGALGSYALFGMMFGALTFGTLADKIGRKKGIAICFALFSSATIVNGFASNPTEFGICRFLAGLGCGGLMPNAVALMNEYAPKRLRSTLVAVMFSGYSLGGMLAAGVGIYMLPTFGWQSMFFAAAVPQLLLPVILYYLPESIGFLVRQGRIEEARSLLKRLDPDCDVQADDVLQAADRKGSSASVLELFRNGLAIRTLALWVAFFCCLLMVYALSSWLPKLMANAGYSLGSSLSFLLALNFGGMGYAFLVSAEARKLARLAAEQAEVYTGVARLVRASTVEVEPEAANELEQAALSMVRYAPRRITLPPGQPQAHQQAGKNRQDGEQNAGAITGTLRQGHGRLAGS